MRRVRSLAAAAAAALALGAAVSMAVAPVASAGTQPRIVAKPDNLMVNTSTVLTGSGFQPKHKVLIQECSKKSWVVPLRVCNHPNEVRVRTNAKGGFQVKLKALVCPVSRHATPALPTGFKRTCYVGVPHIQGVDTVALEGAAKIIVTGP